MSGWERARRLAALRTLFINPRAPSVPATLDIGLDEYYAGCALVGIVAAQPEEPDKKWVCDWSLDVGDMMGAAVKRRRRKR
jgi:hypothetical protein